MYRSAEFWLEPNDARWMPAFGELDNYLSWRRGTTEAVFIEWDRKLIWLSTHAASTACQRRSLVRRCLSRWLLRSGRCRM
jgi:hypothetical protein